MSQKPKLFLVPVTTLRGNVGHEWHGATGCIPALDADSASPIHCLRCARERGVAIPARCPHSKPAPRADKRAFWRWLVSITREAARNGSQVRPGGRAGW